MTISQSSSILWICHIGQQKKLHTLLNTLQDLIARLIYSTDRPRHYTTYIAIHGAKALISARWQATTTLPTLNKIDSKKPAKSYTR